MTEANRNFPSRISFWPLCWRRLGRWTRRVPPCNRDFRLMLGSLSAATVKAHRASIRLTLLGANASSRACACRGARGVMSAWGVRRAKAALSSGCKPHPATAPAGSNRSSHGGNEVAEAFD